jgi:hypothetical protein
MYKLRTQKDPYMSLGLCDKKISSVFRIIIFKLRSQLFAIIFKIRTQQEAFIFHYRIGNGSIIFKLHTQKSMSLYLPLFSQLNDQKPSFRYR